MPTLKMEAEVREGSDVIGIPYVKLEEENEVSISRIIKKTDRGIEVDNPPLILRQTEKISAGDRIEFSGENASVISTFKKCTVQA